LEDIAKGAELSQTSSQLIDQLHRLQVWLEQTSSQTVSTGQ
jgi:hypothetical protein